MVVLLRIGEIFNWPLCFLVLLRIFEINLLDTCTRCKMLK